MKQVKFQVEIFDDEVQKFNLNLPVLSKEIIIITETPLAFIKKLKKVDYDDYLEFTPHKGWIDIPIRKCKYLNSNFTIEAHATYKNNFALLCENDSIVIFTHKKIYKPIIPYEPKKKIINLHKEIGNLVSKYYGVYHKVDWIFKFLLHL